MPCRVGYTRPEVAEGTKAQPDQSPCQPLTGLQQMTGYQPVKSLQLLISGATIIIKGRFEKSVINGGACQSSNSTESEMLTKLLVTPG